jgi:putative transposase
MPGARLAVEAAAMPRIPRTLLVDVGSSHHCMFRAHNDMLLFEDAQVAEHFLSLLARYKKRYGILIHSYVLMGTHPHVVLTATQGQGAFSAFWKVVNHGIAVFFNRRMRRRGQVVMERLESPAISPDERHLLTVMRYGDLNPVRAGLVASPREWRFSSHRHYAFGVHDPLIDPAPDYLALGHSPRARRLAYQGLFAEPLSAHLRTPRPDLCRLPFIGPAHWVQRQLWRLGLLGKTGPPGLA